MNKIKEILRYPNKIIGYVLYHYLSRFITNDKLYLRLLFRVKKGVWPNLNAPKTFNEKLQWLKLYNRKPEYTTMVDKYAVKEYVASRIGEQYVIPTLGMWDTLDKIEWDKLPAQFVLKTTHGGGGCGVVIVKDKTKLDIEKTKSILSNSLKSDIYSYYREWPYKNVPKRIIAEQFMTSVKPDLAKDLPDYKFYCFNGEPKFVMVATGRYEGDVRFDYFDMDWNKLPLVWDNPNSNLKILAPCCFEEMKDICRKLTKDIPHVRCDLYLVDDKPYFGELTFFDASGFSKFEEPEWDEKIGDLLDLSNIKKNQY